VSGSARRGQRARIAAAALVLLTGLGVAAGFGLGAGMGAHPSGAGRRPVATADDDQITPPAATPTRRVGGSRVVLAAGLAPRVGTRFTSISLLHGGRSRAYLLVHDATSAHAPLIVLLHGSGITAEGELARTGFGPLAAAQHLDLAVPQSIGSTWNSGRCCGAALRQRVDDAGFVHQVVQDAIRRLASDPHRVYLVGYSNGGKLAYGVACSLRGGLAALATYGAGPQLPCPHQAALSVFQGYGAIDPLEPPAGKPANDRGLHPPADQTLASILVRDGCPGAPQVRNVGPATIRTWTGCAGARRVQAVRWAGQSHSWPAAPQVPSAAGATALMWQFLTSIPPA
jgi:polyhydroxybutyrate depolymerase